MSRSHQKSGWNGPMVTNLRARWQRTIDEADRVGRLIPCPFCGEPVRTGQEWDLDHSIPLSEGGPLLQVRPAHRSCNRADGARATNQLIKDRLQRTRRWL